MRRSVTQNLNLMGDKLTGFLVLAMVWIALTASLAAQPAKTGANWENWKFLLGDWVGQGEGQPGRGTGGFSFHPHLQDRILMRKNHAEYPAFKDQPASIHDDLMIIYQEPDQPVKAIYFDNEGHVINYSAEFSKDGNMLTFVSEPAASVPRYRLTYTKAGKDTLNIKFEIAPPGKPDEFTTYLEAKARKK